MEGVVEEGTKCPSWSMRPLGEHRVPLGAAVQTPATWESRCQLCLVTSAHASAGTVNHQMLHSYDELWTAGQKIKEVRLRSVEPLGDEK